MIGGGLGVFLLSVVLVACGGSSADSSDAEARRFQDMWEIDKLEKDFHQATSDKDIDLMLSLYSPTRPSPSAGERPRWAWTRSGVLARSRRRSTPRTRISDHPAYKLEVTVNGDRGTLHFECHFVDAETSKVVAVTAGDADVARIEEWLITNFVGGTTEL